MLCTHKTTILCQFGLFFVTSLLTHISINSQPFLVGIVSNITCMIWALTHEDSLRCSWFSMWEFLSIRDCLVENVEWTSPNMKVMELSLPPSCLGEEIIWAEACGRIRNLVVEIGSILYCNGPQGGVRDFWPMYG